MSFDINTIKRKMLVKFPFFGSVVANVSYKEDSSIDTAATDGESIYYNTEFLNELDINEQAFILSHEVCHIAFNHILRSEGKNQELWNIATDAVINQLLKKDGLKIVNGGIDLEDAINYDAETYYEKLLKDHKQNSNNQQGGQDKQQGGVGSNNSKQSIQSNNECSNTDEQGSQDKQQGNDENSENSKKDENSKSSSNHSMWQDAVKKHREKQNSKDNKPEGNNKNKGKKNTETDNNKDNNKESELGKKQKELEKKGEKNSFSKNRKEKKKQLEKLKEELIDCASKAGSTTNSDIRNVNNIGYSKPIMDWRYVLREATKNEVDWSYRNATIEEGIITPHLEDIPFAETEILLDTSGSIDEDLLKNFLRECKNIMQHSRLKVGCFDTKFYGFNEIRCESEIDNMKFVGGGGTDFDVAALAFSNRVENKIIFTDGEANMPKKPVDAIWIVLGTKKINPIGGKVIYIDNEDLERMCRYSINNKKKQKSVR